jgi:hypothetical protein
LQTEPEGWDEHRYSVKRMNLENEKYKADIDRLSLLETEVGALHSENLWYEVEVQMLSSLKEQMIAVGCQSIHMH